ncbi:MAG: hypothetical protein EOO68_15475 [Moraxellaceae bacterium]|nr:MAG: hypothetical protein EOO68_15475 [Moraxellaceae bacterium]
MNNNLVKSLVALGIALAVIFYFINSKKHDTAADGSNSTESGAGKPVHTRTIESSAMSGVVSSTTQNSAVQGDGVAGSNNESVNYSVDASGQNVGTAESELPASVQETIRERRAGSQNSGVDKSRTDAAAGAVKAYEEAEGKK